MKHENITRKIIGCAYKVHNTLGFGFLEKIYENALVIELNKNGLIVKQQSEINVYYENQLVGEYYADIVVNDEIIVELKSVQNLAKEHEVQLVNYLQATGKEVGLLINFGKSVEVKRKIREIEQDKTKENTIHRIHKFRRDKIQ